MCVASPPSLSPTTTSSLSAPTTTPNTMSFLSMLVKPLAYVSLPVFALHTLSN
ncbi:hypothetical protein EVJ58_g6563 [Rhodofomes roseus]|uniref:Uncharacterized protein n=1 Tax=Rhodofomes roseus TaxID=34475 RepID=A0A4Y9Y802_9APHY|nr:hypothetical protein EVJ58_g6563 [Rhodofomes roseus]